MNINSENYKFVGPVNRYELVKLYSYSDIFVLPSFFESFGYSALESMSCGVPVIASNVSAIPEIIENDLNGILVKPGSIKELAETIIYLLDNPDIRRRMGQKARETVLKRFTWKKTVNNLINIYHKALYG